MNMSDVVLLAVGAFAGYYVVRHYLGTGKVA